MKKLFLSICLLCAFAVISNAQKVTKSLSKTRTTVVTMPSDWQNPGTTTNANSTVIVNRCATGLADTYRKAHDSIYKMQRDVMDTYVEQWVKDHPNYDEKTTVTIPVVVHIIYNTAAQNISDTRVTQQIAATNADFAGTNAHSMEAFSTSLKANTNIQFCLAVRDPSGNSTTGITRTQTSVTQFNTQGSGTPCSSGGYPERCTSTGGCAAWDVTKYMNIWVCNMGNNLCGISEFPSSPLDNYYGSSIEYTFFGTTGATAPYNLGGTLTHELGHCFNLYHIWGDDGGACSGSDNCNDTPNQANESINTNNWSGVHTDACTGTSPGIMYMNFMDYSDDIDYANFTPNQVSRMAAIVASTGPDYSLTTSNGCTPVTAGAPVANFTASATNISTGTTVTFTDLSTNTPTSWLWTLTPSTGFTYASGTSTSQNPHITFNTAGTYTVAMKATNSYGNNTCTKTAYIIVTTGGTSTCDTLHYPMTGTAVIYQDANGGYCAGNNSYTDKAKADYFATYSPYTQITGAYFYFGKAKHTGTTTNITFKIWNNTGTGGAPGTTAISTATLTLASIVTAVTNNQPVYVPFTPVNIPGPFYVGVVLPTVTGDTLALVTNTDGDVTTGTAWEQSSGSTWYPFTDATNSWGLTVDMAIWPIVCTGTVTSINESSLGEINIFPNPANNTLNVDLANYSDQKVNIKLYNTVGELVKTLNNNASTQFVTIDLADVKSGIYFVNIQTENGTTVRKISVIK